ncbi:Protein SENSITIVE TO PROTON RHIZOTOXICITY 1 [Camellia lanceoleosa]|uniref:Protein SENSITIVE TO PROTON RHIZOTOXICITY 1 n=1 Tax=Camellia lanceoleosa TaxID=1840588 RepID=A0ACC0FZU6_9ERIC|nr:Protein SENSITIVE TO PROTON RHIZOTOXICITY 1 [Camellia lanceoleosa]
MIMSEEKSVMTLKVEDEEMKDEIGSDDWEIIELDAVELLVEHIHFCDICKKGFKHDANLCNRNKSRKKSRLLKSAICMKNRFKRSHCSKMYSCNRYNKKSFSVLVDLKSHLKHCGESKWKCSCGNEV